METNNSLTRCPRCLCGKSDYRHCWCPFCHPVVVDELRAHCDQPALCIGTPEAAQWEFQPSPEVLALVMEQQAKRLRRRIRLVTKSVPDGPVVSSKHA